MRVVLSPEPGVLLEDFVEDRGHSGADGLETQVLTPWKVSRALASVSPAPLRPFAERRVRARGTGLPGFAALELAARVWSGADSEKLLASKFQLRRLAAQWALRQRVLRDATEIVAPSHSARALFKAFPHARKILFADLPVLGTFQRDLERAASLHPDCASLRLGTRIPRAAELEQEQEWRDADEIHVRSRYAYAALIERGVSPTKIFLTRPKGAVVQRRVFRPGPEVRVLLAGDPCARNGSRELLAVLESRPWLCALAKAGEGADADELFSSPQVFQCTDASIGEVDAVILPVHCETYAPELLVAEASRIPVIATLPGAAHMHQEELYAELPRQFGPALGVALDALRSATEVDPRQPVRTPPPGHFLG